MSDEAYKRWQDALAARREPGADQSVVGPAEHGAYAELLTRERPFLGPLSLYYMIPGYQALKLAKHLTGRTGPQTSPPSISAPLQAYAGIGRGTIANMKDLAARLRD